MYTVAGAKQAVTQAVKSYLYKDKSGKYIIQERNRLPLYLEGAPGIGKTELVEQVAKELQLGFVSFSLVHHTRNSLLGLPVIENLQGGDKYTTYTMSEIIAKVQEETEKRHREGILLLDEFPCMSETIMPVMLAFLQTKNIGEHHLPEGWVIVLCGNPPKFNKSARRFDSAVLDRIRKIETEFDATCFIEYGKTIGLEPVILTYLEMHPEHAYRCCETNGVHELVTCRGWENLSHAFRTYREFEQEPDEKCIKQFIKSDEIYDNFSQYVKQYKMGLSKKQLEEILEGKGFEKYKQKLKELSKKQQIHVVNSLCNLLDLKPTAIDTGKAKYREIGTWLGNVLDMMKEVDPSGMLEEKVFQWTNGSERLVRTVSTVKVPQYVYLADIIAGNTDEILFRE